MEVYKCCNDDFVFAAKRLEKLAVWLRPNGLTIDLTSKVHISHQRVEKND